MGKRSLLVGSSSPIGYDYHWSSDEQLSGNEPYPILEDINGILLCYDELIFLARAFCPREMWDLPYVRFLEDELDLHDRIALAACQFDGIQGPGPILTQPFSDVIDRITGGNPDHVDNHGRSVQVAGGYQVTGNAGDLSQVVVDMGIAASLEIPGLDVLTNTFGTERLAASVEIDPTFLGSGFKSWHLTVATEIAELRIANLYTSGRSYHDEIEDLRSHPNVKEFRVMLSAQEVEGRDAREAAAEITDMVERFASRQVAKRFTRRPWYRTVGRMAIGPGGNFIHPGLGSAANGAVKVVEYMNEREDRAIGSWAAFVANLKQ